MDGSSQVQEVHVISFCDPVQFLYFFKIWLHTSTSAFISSLLVFACLAEPNVVECESELPIYMVFSCTSCKACLPLGTAVVQIITNNNNMFLAKRLNSIIIWQLYKEK